MAWINKKTGEVRSRPGSKGMREWEQISSSRVKEIESTKAIQRAKAQYAPGGSFGKGIEAGLERGRVKAVSSGMQNLVSAGLAGTTAAGGLGLRYEEEVAAPTRANLESERARLTSSLEMQEAGMGFQASQAGFQRDFQASESSASRTLQTYIADLTASLEREKMTTGGPQQSYAQRFPTMYGTQGGGSLPGAPDLFDSPGPGSSPKAYNPSMVGKSTWAQQGSSVFT